ncbi:PTS system, sucrose-specific IIC component [Andreprevotia lacus DSM 23236]|jgi:PTS system sucrose-specific IIC component|uniref:PTS system N-acetylmuramic acid-specific EIIBC component n=1 Tax=Andreprevotia lacus DSM 23236 TaxID=1121001 RepID=A0A1W1XUT9_9NEIS|nr:PTS transporter subunit EIIC [Andreprevotia lacus]SMC27750.1 PTS system, sucrose-specific IIC component [Andreprevotia lacus DSM 23236]
MTQTDTRAALAAALLKYLGGAANVADHTHCMTRLRVTLHAPERADLAALKALPGVHGVVSAETLQIILGPGVVTPVSEHFARQLKAVSPTTLAEQGATLRQNHKQRNQTPFKQFLRRISSIFVPMIPALIGAGFINAVSGIAKSVLAGPLGAQLPWLLTLASVTSLIGSAFFAFLLVQAGINTAREFGGTPALGGAVAGIILLPALKDFPAFSLPLLGEVALKPGQGGLMGALFAAALLAFLERRIRARIPAALDTIVTPTLALLLTGLAVLFVIMPVAGVLSVQVGKAATALLHHGGMPAAFALALSFLSLLMFGLHQALIPIHAELISQYGYTALFPILAMAGCGHAGAAIAVYFRLKSEEIRRVIRTALPICMMGVGEPLLYGVTLPLGRPFFTASLGGGVGALVLGWYASQGHFIGASTIGPANLMLIPLVTGPLGIPASVAGYVTAAAVAYLAGFTFTWFFGLSREHLEQYGAAQTDKPQAPGDGLRPSGVAQAA